MKILFLLTVLTISVIGIANAGLDSIITQDSVIAIYQFEIEDSGFDGDGEYIGSSGPYEFHGNIQGTEDFEWMSDNGRFGTCLLLKENVIFDAFTEHSPHLTDGFSIVAWVKLGKQTERTSLYFSFAGINIGTTPYSDITLAVDPSGNIRVIQQYVPRGIGVAISFFGTQDQNVADNNWHHIAFSDHARTRRLFIDGEVVAENKENTPLFSGRFASFQIGSAATTPLTGEVLIDDVGIFGTGFSPYEVKGLYDDGLEKFLEVMPVNLQSKLATSWGNIKSRK